MHDELENVNHGDLLDVLVEVSGTQILFHLIGLEILACKHVKNNLVCIMYIVHICIFS